MCVGVLPAGIPYATHVYNQNILLGKEKKKVRTIPFISTSYLEPFHCECWLILKMIVIRLLRLEYLKKIDDIHRIFLTAKIKNR